MGRLCFGNSRTSLPDARSWLTQLFFTNATSRKGEELRANPRAALCFYWDSLHEQVRFEGSVVSASVAESDDYWATRPRQAQIAAWASAQSRATPSRQALEEQVAAVAREFEGRPVPRPPHWHGFRLVPERIEFWIGRPGRLHDRELFERQGEGWHHSRLQP